jgi:glycosyltransferase involved in cell wall biosynthesis
MNPEYVILGGLFWKLWKKPVILWYMHRAVNMRLYLAEKLVTKIFTGSPESVRIKTSKKEVVGHGIMIENVIQAKEEALVGKGTLKILTVGRISRVKNIEKIIDTAVILKEKNIPFLLDIIGPSITDDDVEYKKYLLNRVEGCGLGSIVHFRDAIPHEEIIRQYASYHLFLHTSATGSLDKVVLEALAAGLVVFTTSDVVYKGSNEEFLVKLAPKASGKDIAEAIEKRYFSGILIPTKKGREYVKNNHNLDKVIADILSSFRANL